MAKSERQRRYRTHGGAAGLKAVEVLVPPEGRAQVLKLAAGLRRQHRNRLAQSAGAPGAPRPDLSDIVEKARLSIRKFRTGAHRRSAKPVDIDRLVTASVNVPFPRSIDAVTLARSISENCVPPAYKGHLERFLGELPLRTLLSFCDHHQIDAPTLARFVRDRREALALHRPDLEEHLDAAVPDS